MNLYRHYKNKPYRFIDLVRHSETQEDLVLYETLYDNPGGKLWVRPKDMFFETIQHEGKSIPRFAKVECEIETHPEFTNKLRETIKSLADKCFDVWKKEEFETRVHRYKTFHISIAKVDSHPVGFKIGYETAEKLFYSWLGAVVPDYQRSGVASMLMQNQHDWCRDQNYQIIRTKCLNFNLPMLKLNLKSGFLVTDTELTEEGLKLVLEKRLFEKL